ncbi:hypothetical protein D3Z52_00410 [Clostridiaceae bacterium]|nr:hypothetical protein [Clostridiaceae bacterium]NBI81191.1 hypothetical protein [Clostridiaceae bacterium]RKJ83025.1 hypothetical protein D7X33_00795 [Butyricicoccus sp. 1XD8-22]
MRTSIPEKVLMELWQGHIIPSEDAPIRKDYSEVMKDITTVRTLLQSIQPEDARILTDKLLGLLAQSADMESETAFIRGYQLGARLTLAALDEKGDYHAA